MVRFGTSIAINKAEKCAEIYRESKQEVKRREKTIDKKGLLCNTSLNKSNQIET